MKLIFLSTDGVLSSEAHLEYISKRGSKYMEDTFNQIDKSKISLLNFLVSKSSANVVFTGLWKNSHSYQKINDMLAKCGANWEAIDSVPYVYKTTSGKFATNVDEVEEFISRLDVFPENMVILDDRNDWGKYSSNLVRVNYDRGLKPFHIERALGLLGVNRKNKLK